MSVQGPLISFLSLAITHLLGCTIASNPLTSTGVTIADAARMLARYPSQEVLLIFPKVKVSEDIAGPFVKCLFTL